jgi:phosphopantetheinyl transferase
MPISREFGRPGQAGARGGCGGIAADSPWIQALGAISALSASPGPRTSACKAQPLRMGRGHVPVTPTRVIDDAAPADTIRRVVPPDPVSDTTRWPPAPVVPHPGARVYITSIGAAEPAAAVLHREERARASTIRFEPARRRYVAGRALLRSVLGDVVGEPPEALRFSYGPRGKPRLAGPRAARPFFSLSHSCELAALVVAGESDVGIDVECLRPIPRALPIAGRRFEPAVGERLRDLAPEERSASFLRHWVRIEAAAKATGWGVASLLDAARDLRVTEGVVEGLTDDMGRPAPALDVIDLPFPMGYVGALAVQSPRRTSLT